LQGLARIGHDARSVVSQVVKALSAEDAKTRREAAVTLGAVGAGSKDAVKALADALKDGQFEVGLESARALAKLGENKQGVTFLTNALKRRTGQEERLACVRALGQIGPPASAAAPALADALEEAGLREEAGAALVRLGRGAVGVLQKRMVASPDAKARLACVTLVGKIAAADRLSTQSLRGVLQSLQAVIRLDPVTENREEALRVAQQIQGGR
jgi:HEAT repeat protein